MAVSCENFPDTASPIDGVVAWAADLAGSGEAAPPDPSRVPADLDSIEPGPELAAILWDIDVRACAGHDQVRVLQAHQRLASHYHAQVLEDIAAVAGHMEVLDDGDLELAHLATSAEVRAALRWTRRAADSQVDLALDLERRLPAVWRALLDGRLDPPRARVMVAGTSHLTADAARAVVDLILDDAPSLTTGQITARLRRLCIEADPESAVEEYRQELVDRRFTVEANPAGTASVVASNIGADRAQAARRHVNRVARSLKSAGETRTMDQLRADVAMDLLAGADVMGTARAGGTGGVNLTVSVETLAGLSNEPAELGGFGPVVAEVAQRVVAEQASRPWTVTVTDRAGRAVAAGPVRRRPTASVTRVITAAQPTCVFPGCRMPAVECDLDHRRAWADGGATSVDNLSPLCRHDHLIKHELGWRYEPTESGVRWTSRLGHTYMATGPP